MEEKNFVQTVNENYEEMKVRKNDWGLLTFGILILLLAVLGVYGIVNLVFSILNITVIKIVVTLSLFLNVIFAFLRFDEDE